MPKRLTYKFTIGAFNPDTIPMSRLSEYMPDLASLLGEPSSVHFSNLETGSTVLSVTVGTEAIPKVSERIAQVSSGYIPDEIKKHFDGLRYAISGRQCDRFADACLAVADLDPGIGVSPSSASTWANQREVGESAPCRQSDNAAHG